MKVLALWGFFLLDRTVVHKYLHIFHKTLTHVKWFLATKDKRFYNYNHFSGFNFDSHFLKWDKTLYDNSSANRYNVAFSPKSICAVLDRRRSSPQLYQVLAMFHFFESYAIILRANKHVILLWLLIYFLCICVICSWWTLIKSEVRSPRGHFQADFAANQWVEIQFAQASSVLLFKIDGPMRSMSVLALYNGLVSNTGC